MRAKKIGFVCAPSDQVPVAELKKHLSALLRTGLIEFVPSSEAEGLFVIVSPQLLLHGNLLHDLERRYKAGSVRLLPVAYESCAVHDTWLGQFQPIGASVWVKTVLDLDEAWMHIALALRRTLNRNWPVLQKHY